ncbi:MULTISPECIES: LCP family protein [Streptomyces]|uniref:LCP family protein n=1 Tax=Streptomyces TaxID=1883 RepID=UPI001F24E65F|nr:MULTISPECIES: LCP family protein [Streptomyces]
MSESAGTPAEPPQEPRRRRPWLRRTALGAAVAVLAAAGTGWALYQQLEGNIRTDRDTARELEQHSADRPAAVVHDALNILLIGSDSRGGGNGAYGRDTGTQRSDTTILLHLSADRESATAVSIPRDLMVDIPACTQPDGTRSEARFAQFNWAFEFAGAGCTIRTVEEFTGVRVDHHMILDFSGFKNVVDAVGGVEVCLEEPVDDPEAQVTLPAGQQTLHGEDALGYVRARYSIGDGSDTERMARQQEFLGSLVRKVQSDGVLLNPGRLYDLLDSVTSSITTDPGLASLQDLYDLATSMREMPSSGVRFLTVPRQPYQNNPNRDELVQPAASQLFEALLHDRPVTVEPRAEEAHQNEQEGPGSGSASGSGTMGTESGAPPSGTPEAERDEGQPGYRGTTAETGACV